MVCTLSVRVQTKWKKRAGFVLQRSKCASQGKLYTWTQDYQRGCRKSSWKAPFHITTLSKCLVRQCTLLRQLIKSDIQNPSRALRAVQIRWRKWLGLPKGRIFPVGETWNMASVSLLEKGGSTSCEITVSSNPRVHLRHRGLHWCPARSRMEDLPPENKMGNDIRHKLFYDTKYFNEKKKTIQLRRSQGYWQGLMRYQLKNILVFFYLVLNRGEQRDVAAEHQEYRGTVSFIFLRGHTRKAIQATIHHYKKPYFKPNDRELSRLSL